MSRLIRFALSYVECDQPFGVAQLVAHMTPGQISIAVDRVVDGQTIEQVAERHQVSRATVIRAVRILKKTLARFDVPMPKRSRSTSRHVRQIPEAIAKQL